MDFLKLFPQLLLIKEKELSKKTEEVWKKAVKMGGWSESEVYNIPFTLLIDGTQVSIIEHTEAVTDCAIKIADMLETHYKDVRVNRDYLIAGALLHDVGKLLEYRFTKSSYAKSRVGELLRHPVSGANLASSAGLPTEVVHIIYTHSKEGDSYERTPESIIIHYCDFINFEILKRRKNVF